MPRIQNKSIRVSNEIHAKLSKISEKIGVTLAEFVEEAIEEKIFKTKMLASIRPEIKDSSSTRPNRRFGHK